MEYYFDTSSLVALARYYHPFDKNGRLFDFVRSKFQNKEIIVLDAIPARGQVPGMHYPIHQLP